MHSEVKIGGFGGQGVILSGHIIGKAAALFDKKYATMIQSFGPEARGSACSAQVLLDDSPILYPYVLRPDILITFSQEAYTKFGPELKEGGILIHERDLVDVTDTQAGQVWSIPATAIAEKIGRKIVLNIVMIGFFTAVTNYITFEAMESAVKNSIPKGTEIINLTAFEKGYSFGIEEQKKQKGSEANA